MLLWTLLALTMIDFDTQLLPDNITLPLLWAGLIVNLWGVFASLPDAVIGAVAGYLSLWTIYWLFKLIRGKEGMGYGDFKLLAALGAWLGWQMLPVIVLLSSVVGARHRHRADRVQGPRSQHPAGVRPLSRDRRVRSRCSSAGRWSGSSSRDLVVGLTGGIGSGKSAVADAFAALGVDVTDTDRIAHALTAPGQPGHAADACGVRSGIRVRRRDARPGAPAPARVRRRGCARRLEAILHPLIREAARREIAAWTSPYGLLVVPLLFERGDLSGVDRVLVVDCPEDEQVRRVTARSGLAARRGARDHGHAAGPARAARARRRRARQCRAAAAIAPQVADLDRRYRELAAAAAKNRGAAA